MLSLRLLTMPQKESLNSKQREKKDVKSHEKKKYSDVTIFNELLNLIQCFKKNSFVVVKQ